MKRMDIIIAVILVLGTMGLTFAVRDSNAAGASTIPDHIVLTWAENPATTQTITWRTDAGVTSGMVEFEPGSAVTRHAKRVSALMSEYANDLGQARIFSATLHGLSPNTKYSYRVGDGINWSTTHVFTTADPKSESFKFLVFGDSQSGKPADPNYEPWRTTVHNAFAKNHDARFMMNVGDLVEEGNTGVHWNNWFSAASGVIDSIPEMPVEGNHETYGKTIDKRGWTPQFTLPQNGPDKLKGRVYSYDYGNVHFVVLDSQQDEEKDTIGDVLEMQKGWLDADLAASKAAWKIVLFHKTPYSLKASRMNEAIKAAFCPIIEKHHVDLVLTGHDHGIGRTYAIYQDKFVSKPSQGSIYYVTGRSGNKSYPDLSGKFWNTYFYDPQDQPNYLVVNVSKSKLTVDTFKQDGVKIDSFFIDKAKDVDTDTALHPVPTSQWSKYAKPTAALYGNVFSPNVSRHEPVQKNGEWFVDAAAFAANTNAVIDTSSTRTTISLGGKSVRLGKDDVIVDNEVLLIPSNSLKTFGFSTSYNPAVNVVSIIK